MNKIKLLFLNIFLILILGPFGCNKVNINEYIIKLFCLTKKTLSILQGKEKVLVFKVDKYGKLYTFVNRVKNNT